MRGLQTKTGAALVLAFALTFCAIFTGSLHADEAPSRVVAIGDIHGAWEPFVEILQRAQLVDKELNWSGGDTLFIQTGDFVDKGPDVRKVMDLLISLQVHAPKSGGRVLILKGNHEAMNLMGLIRDVDPEAYLQFVDDDSEKRRAKAYKAHVRLTRRRASQLGLEPTRFDDAARDAWMDEHPPGLVEYLAAMSSNGVYGKWIRTLPVAEKIDDVLFIHAGIPPEMASLSVAEINRQVDSDVRQFDDGLSDLLRRGTVLPSYSWVETELSIANEFNGYRDRAERENRILPEDREYMYQLAEFLEFLGGSLLASQGPLWFRGFAKWPEAEGSASIDQLAVKHGVGAFVSGHTPAPGGEIRIRFGNRVFLIDTGMLKKVYNGRPSALEIRDGRIRALYPDEEETLTDLNAPEG